MALCDTRCLCTVVKVICLYVGALLGVWGIIPLFCVPDHESCWHGVCWLGVVGVLCENCIVDASIKHVWMGCFVWFVCVCLCDFFFL